MTRTTLGLVVTMALVAAACSSTNDARTSSTTPATSSPAPPTTATPTTAPSTTASPTTAPSTTAPPTTASPTTAQSGNVSVGLAAYPLFESELVVADQTALDELATEYVTTLGGSEPEMERFLFGAVPVEVFDDVFAGSGRFDPPTVLWLMHLSGYFGGRWLRGEIASAQPEALLVGFSSPPTAEGFAATVANADVALQASLTADDETVLAYAAASLLDTPPEEPDGEPTPGLTDSFGYNAGYMLEILASPPEGVSSPPEYQVSCDRLLSCQYASPKLAILADLAPVAAAINGDDPDLSDLAENLRPIQDAAIPRGRGVWSGGLSVQGFDQKAYDQLLDVSSSFLETVEATALTMVKATGDQEVESARVGALANAAMIVWLDAYIAGLTNGEGAIELPTFES